MKRTPLRKRGKSTKSKLRREAKTLFSLFIRKRDGECLYSGIKENLQAAHIMSVGAYRELEFDEQNVIALSKKHHMYGWHRNPAKYLMWFIAKFPERWEYLQEMVRKIDSGEYEVKYTEEYYQSIIDKYTPKTSQSYSSAISSAMVDMNNLLS